MPEPVSVPLDQKQATSEVEVSHELLMVAAGSFGYDTLTAQDADEPAKENVPRRV